MILCIIETQSLGLGLGCVDDCKAILYVFGYTGFFTDLK